MIKLVNIKNDENINIVNKINDYNTPEKIFVPVYKLEEYKINDYIYKNSLFSNSVSSISGIISGVDEIYYDRKKTDCFVIVNDYKENIKSKSRKIKINSIDDLKGLLKKYLLNDILDKISKFSKINNLIVSSIDEECYSVKEFIRLSNNYREILDTVDRLINMFSLNKSMIVTKNTNFNSIKNVKSIIGTYPNIKISLVPDKYLIGREEFLIEYLNLKKEDTLVLTTNEIYSIYSILNAKYITDQTITISGNAIKKSLIINTRLGVSLKELLKEYIEIKENDYEIFVNGFFSGYKILNGEDTVITSNIDYVVINKRENSNTSECINCGACYKICPYDINVKRCYFKKLSHKKCIGCGLCNYICPANINLKEIVKSDNNEKKFSK